MRRWSLFELALWGMTVLALWGGVSPRVLCTTADGHAAIEGLDSQCCRGDGDGCDTPAPPAAVLRSGAPLQAPPRPEAGLPSRAPACRDSVLHSRPGAPSPVLSGPPDWDAPPAAPEPPLAPRAPRRPDPRALRPPVPLDSRTTLLI